jgi:hypothetical protein
MEDKNVLPVGFDGVFRFTNFTDSEFKASWNKKEYTFPPKSTVPMIILDATPQEIQYIRKKFAKELAEKVFFEGESIKKLDAMNTTGTQNSFRTAVTYTPKDLEIFVQRCLEPMPIARATVVETPPVDEDKILRKDNKGKRVSKVLDGDESLIGNGTVMQ